MHFLHHLHARFAMPALVLLVVAALHAPALWNARAPSSGELLLDELPLARLVLESARAGALPYWTDRMFLGYPLLAAGGSGALHPTTALVYRAVTALNGDARLAVQLDLLVHHALLALLMFVWAGRHIPSRSARGLLALVVACSTFVLGHLGSPGVIRSLPYLPVLMMCATLPGARGLGCTGLALGALALAGDADTGLAVGAGWIGYLTWQERERGAGSASRVLRRVIPALALGAGVAACQLVPLAELLSQATRPLSLAPQADRFQLLLALAAAACAGSLSIPGAGRSAPARRALGTLLWIALVAVAARDASTYLRQLELTPVDDLRQTAMGLVAALDGEARVAVRPRKLRPSLRALFEAGAGNAAVLEGAGTLTGIARLPLASWVAFLSHPDDPPTPARQTAIAVWSRLKVATDAKKLDLANVTHVLSGDVLPGGQMARVSIHPYGIGYRRAGARGWAYVAYPVPAAAAAMMGGFAVSAPGAPEVTAAAMDAPGLSATVETHRGGLLVARTRTQRDGFMVAPISRYPGWEARMDGQPVPLATAAGTFLAVALPAGAHRVEFEFVPRSFRAGVWVTAACIFLALGLIWRGRV